MSAITCSTVNLDSLTFNCGRTFKLCVTALDLLNKIAELALATFFLICDALRPVWQTVQSVHWDRCLEVLTFAVGISGFVNLIKDIMGWSDKSNWNTPAKLATLATMTVAHTLSMINFFHKIGIINLARMAGTVSRVCDVVFIAGLVCDIWQNKQGIDKCQAGNLKNENRIKWWTQQQKIAEAAEKRREPVAIPVEITQKLSGEKGRVTYWKGKAAEIMGCDVADVRTKINRNEVPKSAERAVEKFKEWSTIEESLQSGIGRATAIKKLCEYKIEKLHLRTDNNVKAVKLGWTYIATDISFIAMFVLGLALPVFGSYISNIAIPIGIFSVLATSMDLISFGTAKTCFASNDLLKWQDFIGRRQALAT